MYSKENIIELFESIKEDMLDSKHDLPKYKYYSELIGFEIGCNRMIKVLDAYYECVKEEWE